MDRGSFIVSFNEVLNSEIILFCRSVIKEEIGFWKNSELAIPSVNFEILIVLLNKHSKELAEANLIFESNLIGNLACLPCTN